MRIFRNNRCQNYRKPTLRIHFRMTRRRAPAVRTKLLNFQGKKSELSGMCQNFRKPLKLLKTRKNLLKKFQKNELKVLSSPLLSSWSNTSETCATGLSAKPTGMMRYNQDFIHHHLFRHHIEHRAIKADDVMPAALESCLSCIERRGWCLLMVLGSAGLPSRHKALRDLWDSALSFRAANTSTKTHRVTVQLVQSDRGSGCSTASATSAYFRLLLKNPG